MIEYSNTKTIIGLSITALSIALGLFIASLFLPVFFTEGNTVLGYWVLVTGWIGFIGFQFAWYANTFALFALYYSRKKPTFAFFIAISSILIASQAYLFDEIPSYLPTDTPHNEKSIVLNYGSGFYIWYFSFYFVATSILLRIIAQATHKSTVEATQPTPTQVETKGLANTRKEDLPTVVIQHIVEEEKPIVVIDQSIANETVVEEKEQTEIEVPLVVPPPLPVLNQRADQ
ncbi:MAG: hypothetical protein KAH22_08065 [Thiotrichaceae bacterium]|nr:hypothetical protein [Thiotrichaceae bacterium]